MCAAILAARLQCGGGGTALVAGGDCARRGVAHAASIVCSIYVRTKQGRKKKEYSIVEKGDKKVTVSVGDPKNTPAHCT